MVFRLPSTRMACQQKGRQSHFEEIIQLSNHNNEREKSEIDIPDEPIMAFESGESFLKKTGPIKPQHVAGEHLKSSSWAALWHGTFSFSEKSIIDKSIWTVLVVCKLLMFLVVGKSNCHHLSDIFCTWRVNVVSGAGVIVACMLPCGWVHQTGVRG